MSKSIEDLELMTIPQLEGIATGLGATVPKKIKKAQLVQLVFDIQQPEAPEEDTDAETEEDLEPKPVTTEEDYEARLEEIKNHFNGTDIDAVDKREEDDATIFAVTDELTDEEIVRGTFLELEKAMLDAPNDAADLEVEEDAADLEPENNDPNFEKVDTNTPGVTDEKGAAAVKRGLDPLRNLGLKYTIEGSTIKLQSGSKVVTTTLNQPAHRVVSTAEQLCNFRR